MEPGLYILLGVVLVAGLLTLIVASVSRTRTELKELRVERDLLAEQAEVVRRSAEEGAARVGKLSGLLEAALAENQEKGKRIQALGDALDAAHKRIEEETVAARTAACVLVERDGTISQLREAAKVESEQTASRIRELTRRLEDAEQTLSQEKITARTTAATLLEKENALADARSVAQIDGQESARRIQELSTALEDLRVKVEVESMARSNVEGALREKEVALQAMREAALASDEEVSRLHGERAALNAEQAEAKANLVHSQRANEELRGFIAEAQTRLSGTFAELAGKVFEERAQTFTKNVQAAGAQSKADMDLLLKPFADRLAEFRVRVDLLYSEEAKERAALLGAVTELKTLNQDMALQASALTRALKGSSKIRGDWGELILESVLRGSGLEEGVHYDRQLSSRDDEGQRLRPDVIVKLPDDRRVVVDSKVNLLAWMEAVNADSPEQQSEAIRRHSVALRQHVRELSDRNYPKSLGPSTLEITIAFVPIEGALSGALGADTALQVYAFEQRVVFASPNTLMALLGVVERLWTRDKIQRQAIEISEAGGKVLDALGRFLSEFDKVGSRLSGAQEAFSDARRVLTDSSQAVIHRARRLAELGVRGKKVLHADLQPDLADQIELLEEAGPEQGNSEVTSS